jgi:hypothetical protein
MRAVWSFWNKPYEWHYRSRWSSDRQHLLSWILSLETARRHGYETALYTDDAGASVLVEGLGLKFDQVFLSLNALKNHDPRWWCLGKIYTYRLQNEPFIHLDNDVFLWKRLSPALERAAVIAQSPEYISTGAFFYRPEAVDYVIKGINDGWLPREWEWYQTFGQHQRGECCGIFGGNAIGFITHYAGEAIKMIEHPQNKLGWPLLERGVNRNVQVEQYLLSACIEYHRNRPESPFHNVTIEYMFASDEDARNPEQAERAGYTHLLGNSKHDPELNQRLEARVKRDYPEYYSRCISWLARSGDSSRGKKSVNSVEAV